MYGVAVTERTASSKRPSSIQVEKTKAAKRAAAKAARARAVAAQQRRRVLSIAGAAAAVLVLVVGIAWYVQSGDSSTPASNTRFSTQRSAATRPEAAQRSTPIRATPT